MFSLEKRHFQELKNFRHFTMKGTFAKTCKFFFFAKLNTSGKAEHYSYGQVSDTKAFTRNSGTVSMFPPQKRVVTGPFIETPELKVHSTPQTEEL